MSVNVFNLFAYEWVRDIKMYKISNEKDKIFLFIYKKNSSLHGQISITSRGCDLSSSNNFFYTHIKWKYIKTRSLFFPFSSFSQFVLLIFIKYFNRKAYIFMIYQSRGILTRHFFLCVYRIEGFLNMSVSVWFATDILHLMKNIKNLRLNEM